MARAFCTLFDSNFLFRGLALYESLSEHFEEFTLWILCMDQKSHQTLTELALPYARLVSLAEFEDPELLAAKAERTPIEYCWTCTPALPLWVLEQQPDLDSITYLDADLMFFRDDQPLVDELGAGSVAIIEHRFSARWEHLVERSGVFNVEYLIFKNDPAGRRALTWWRDRCVEWCYDRVEDGKMADQMYLNDWPERFEGVVVLQHPGAGLAPWNIDRFRVSSQGRSVTVDGKDLIFFHYSSFAIIDKAKPRFVAAYPEYRISTTNEKLVYGPYVGAIQRAIDLVHSIDAGFDHGIQHALPEDTAARRWGDRRNRIVRFAERYAPTRAMIGWARRIKGAKASRMRTADPTPQASDSTKDSWKAEEVARQQEELVMKELERPEDVPPFRAFIQLAEQIAAAAPDSVTLKFLDVGCGVGHYSELLERYVPARFDYTGADYSEAMIARARALWPGRRFVVDDILDTQLDLGSYDVVMAGALIDVIEDYEVALSVLLSSDCHYVLLHRQELTQSPSSSDPTWGYEGQVTFSTRLNRQALLAQVHAHGLRLVHEAHVEDDVWSLLLERTSSPTGSVPDPA